MAEKQAAGSIVDYKDTLNLPHTQFPLRTQGIIDEQPIRDLWDKMQLYDLAMKRNKGARTFILHDGPPYANGHIHLGHAYNKILKDIITKAYRMSGYHVPLRPGWDCHGLPIELGVTREQPGLTPALIKRACRERARSWIDVQKGEFKELGVIMDWNNPYVTMHPGYEAETIRVFGACIDKGFIARKYKTVAWCMSCMTTLASAEIEYHERKDPSVYVLFPLTTHAQYRLFAHRFDRPVSFLIWTTTPWTLPLNRAVVLKPHCTYALVELENNLVIIGHAAVERVQTVLGKEMRVLELFESDLCEKLFVMHPLQETREVPLIFDDQVALDEGTACVHSAPGCGPTDYELGVRNGLEIYAPVAPDGRYTQGIYPAELEGMQVTDGQWRVLKLLEEKGLLVHKGSLKHSYPHCWRCRNGLIFRATKQWFLDLKQHHLQSEALAIIDSIAFVPERSANFLRATVAHRWEWCLSRQRVWGVPIVALLCEDCDEQYVSQELALRVAAAVEHEGIEWWDTVSFEQLMPAGLICHTCGGRRWKKEKDILDVWFDSGVSHAAVLRKDNQFPADMYLEGVDQYRGWYQSSLLTSMALTGEAPMRVIMSHGFTVDEDGHKMSKSLGNVVTPKELVAKIGTDGVRLWVSCLAHEGDLVLSARVIEHVTRVQNKIRNTCRFLLQNLYDFNYAVDAVAVEELLLMDAMALVHFARFQEQIVRHYQAYNVTGVFHALADYSATFLSAVYCDLVKDRLYVSQPSHKERRSAQTVLWHMLDGLTKLIAPILSFCAEQLAHHYIHDWTGSVHLQSFNTLSAQVEVLAERLYSADRLPVGEPAATRGHAFQAEVYEVWQELLSIRSVVMKAIEEQRERGLIKHSLQAHVVLSISTRPLFETAKRYAQTMHQSLEEFLQELCVVSQLSFKQAAGVEDCLAAHVMQATGLKCPRCWQWRVSTHVNGLCDRCETIVAQIKD